MWTVGIPGSPDLIIHTATVHEKYPRATDLARCTKINSTDIGRANESRVVQEPIMGLVVGLACTPVFPLEKLRHGRLVRHH